MSQDVEVQVLSRPPSKTTGFPPVFCYATSMTHHVIYVPGLGDHYARAQPLAPKYWEVFGLKGHYYAMKWRGAEAFAPKLERLLQMIDELSEDGDKVSLVGTSAGASAVLVAYAVRQDKVTGVVCVCGKINHPETISSELFAKNPAFKEALARLQQVLPKLSQDARARIMSMRPLRDKIVPPADTIIPGAYGKLIPTAGHGFSICVALVLGAGMMMGFLKKQASK